VAFAVGLGLSSVAVLRAARAYAASRTTADARVLWDPIIIAYFVVMPFSYLHWEKYLLPLVPILALRMTKPLSGELADGVREPGSGA
jgi:hypothetical protein